MPELPEVENVRLQLEKVLVNKTIDEVTFLVPKALKNISLTEFIARTQKKQIIAVRRFAKYLIFETETDYIVSHLRMEGKWNIFEPKKDSFPHTLVSFLLSDKKILVFQDFRKFATIEIFSKNDYSINQIRLAKKVALEPWELSFETFYHNVSKRNKAIKAILLDQSIIAGIGNIYADEILFQARILPMRKGKDLSKQEIKLLLEAAIDILQASIKLGGTSIRTYESLNGIKGQFQNHLKVHTKEGQNCFDGRHFVKKIKVSGRGTYYCEGIQK